MFDLGWSELLVIGVVALIVVGPKDLPMLFRNVGRFVGRAKAMAREFSRAMEDAADEAGVKEAHSAFKTATDPLGSALDGVKDAARSLTEAGSESGLSPERAETAAAVREKAAEAATRRRAAEAQAMEEPTPPAADATAKAASPVKGATETKDPA